MKRIILARLHKEANCKVSEQVNDHRKPSHSHPRYLRSNGGRLYQQNCHTHIEPRGIDWNPGQVRPRSQGEQGSHGTARHSISRRNPPPVVGEPQVSRKHEDGIFRRKGRHQHHPTFFASKYSNCPGRLTHLNENQDRITRPHQVVWGLESAEGVVLNAVIVRRKALLRLTRR